MVFYEVLDTGEWCIIEKFEMRNESMRKGRRHKLAKRERVCVRARALHCAKSSTYMKHCFETDRLRSVDAKTRIV